MALAEGPFRVTRKGDWPGPMSFRRGWSRADARPWNGDSCEASLRLVRGGPAFLAACTDDLIDLGAEAVLSPPLPSGARKTWAEAGFDSFIDLALMRKQLDHQPPAPDHLVVEANDTPVEDLLPIDSAAFSTFWRFDVHGIDEAIAATGNSSILVIRDGDGKPIAFAVVGYGNAISYLQRLAVSPQWQGQGMGRSLTRVAARRARAKGAQVMLLNTQFDNKKAIALYEAEGFVLLSETLGVLRACR